MPISAIDAISPAIQHTRQQLFQPFRLGQWLRIALVGFLAGELTSGGCSGNFQLPSHSSGGQRFVASPLSNIDPAAMAGLIALLMVLGAILLLLFLYLSSVMRFIQFDTVVEKKCEIRRGWNRRQSPGLRYFGWQLLLFVIGPLGMALLIGVPALLVFALGWFKDPKQHMVVLVLGGMALFLVFFAFLVAWLLVHVLTKDFVVPQMAIDGIGAFEGWRRFWRQLNSEKGSYAGYIGMKIVMAIGVAVVIGIIAFIVILIVLIPIGGLGAIAVLGGKAAGLQWDLYTITLAVVVGCMFLVVVLYAISLVSVPAMVFFPAYSIYFFAARYPALDNLIHPVPQALPPQVLPEPPPYAPEIR